MRGGERAVLFQEGPDCRLELHPRILSRASGPEGPGYWRPPPPWLLALAVDVRPL